MKISGVIWLEDIAEKLRYKHHVSDHEVIEVLKNHPKFRFVGKGYRAGKNVYTALGRTNSGRYLTVFFVYKKNQQALIVSARDMTTAERKKYGRK